MKLFNFNEAIKTRIIITLFEMCMLAGIPPLIAFHLTDIIGAKDTGIVLSVGVVISLIFALLGGHIGSYYNKKVVLIITNIIFGMALLVMYLSLRNIYILMLIFSYFIFLIMWAIQWPIISAFTMDLIDGNADDVYSVSYWATNLGVALGSLIGTMSYSYRYDFIFVIFALLHIIIAVLYIFKIHYVKKENKDRLDKKNIVSLFKNYFYSLKDFKIMKLIWGSRLLGFGELTLYSYVAIRLKEQFPSMFVGNLLIDGVKMYTIILLINTSIIVTLSFVVTYFFKKISYNLSLLIALLIYLFGYTAISYSNNFFIMVISVIFVSFGEIVHAPAYMTAKYKIVPEEKRSIYEAIDSIFYYVADAIAKYMIVFLILFSNMTNTIIIFLIMLIGVYMLFTSFLYISKYVKE